LQVFSRCSRRSGSLATKQDSKPFFLSLALFALSCAGLGISMYPYIVPAEHHHLAGGIA
jgi:cytochrome bd-type quinol oxidase subunit 2